MSRHTHVSLNMQRRLRDYHTFLFSFPTDSAITYQDFGLLPVRSPLLGKSRLISFPRGTEMFHFSRFASCKQDTACAVGFPIRTSAGIAPLTSLPQLFAG